MKNELSLVKEKDVDDILAYLKADAVNCLYLYIDLAVYRLNNENMIVWKGDQSSRFDVIVMKYHDSFQIYSREMNWPKAEVLELIRQYQPMRITCNRNVSDSLEALLKEDYDCSYGFIFRHKKQASECQHAEDDCAIATLDDIPDIAKLFMHEFGNEYSEEEWTSQLEERYESQMGRSMIIREKGRVIAHLGTFAETEDIAVIGGAIVLDEYRQSDCFERLDRQMIHLLNHKENKEIYFITTSKRYLNFYKKKNELCTTHAKFIRKHERI